MTHGKLSRNSEQNTHKHGIKSVMKKNDIAMHERVYKSSYDNGLELTAEFYVPENPAPLLLHFHGWHQSAAQARESATVLAENGYFVVSPDMRGRGKSGGKPDACGLELLDALDALDFARNEWPEKTDNSRGPYLLGGSGGGGNTMTLAGKAPDIFAAAVSWAGMSDYAQWYKDDEKGCYRDEMETKGWIGGNPDTNSEAYSSRSGVTLLENVLAPLLVMHGKNDTAVLFHHAENYKTKAETLKKENISFFFNDDGHGAIPWHKALPFLSEHKTPPSLPDSGKLIFAGFLISRSFRIIADSPDVMAGVTYKTGQGGQLEHLKFSRDNNKSPLKEIIIEIPLLSEISGFNVVATGKQ